MPEGEGDCIVAVFVGVGDFLGVELCTGKVELTVVAVLAGVVTMTVNVGVLVA